MPMSRTMTVICILVAAVITWAVVMRHQLGGAFDYWGLLPAAILLAMVGHSTWRRRRIR